ncbi:pentafunctional AROM polypeptide [Pseudomassariella vexata]|uniref:Pentafunctional AROM polypeptide n=1 Tax=Pseudomassariella vexata TaxID=1141098 RepID=A0A1Y2E0R9_9PEZI|nr:pentafunctional AROM polypeptide [Pseudomassariella vexata]ORY65079.1 pentafunctional AROM polypeptide [Pseudomassariella vexata]
MTTVQQLQAPPTPARPRSMNGSAMAAVEMDMDRRSMSPAANGIKFGSGPQRGDTRIVVIVYGHGQEKIVSVFADVLGKPYRLVDGFQGVTSADQDMVIGVLAKKAVEDIATRNTALVVAINAHCVNLGMPPDGLLSAQCDYEFLYTEAPFFRRDLARFTSFVLGQINHHEALMAKPRTYFISTTFPDVHAALPNIDILTVGADAVEIRVDLLTEPLSDGSFSEVPSLSYVGEQLMLLRQRTELPIIFTTRCTRENGRFPMDNPDLYYEYLYRAIQWGVEYIDVEVWLPVTIRQKLYEQRGSSRIMSAFHDFSSTFKWPSVQAQSIFLESRKYADIVKMIAFINDHNENFELEYFRSKIRSEYPDAPPLSMVNMGETGQFSRTLNKVFTPITHPLLPIIAAPGQMSAAEINAALSLLGQLPKKSIYGISSPASRISTPQAPFYEKCFNELGLPHHFAVVERTSKGVGCVEAWCNQKAFGGAYLSPPVAFSSIMSNSAFFARLRNGSGPILSEAARVIGMIDTIVVRSSSTSTPESAPASIPSSPTRHSDSPFGSSSNLNSGLPASASLIFDNASWRGILSTLTRDLAPSAYFGRTALVLASSSDDAASAIFALKALQVGKVYTVGFRTPIALARGMVIEPFNSLESLQRARMVSDGASPFVIVSALGPEKSNIVGLLVRAFGGSRASAHANSRKVFLDLADGPRKGDPGVIAEQSGFAAYGVADTTAFTTVEMLRLLVGQNVPYSFVRLASGRGMF